MNWEHVDWFAWSIHQFGSLSNCFTRIIETYGVYMNAAWIGFPNGVSGRVEVGSVVGIRVDFF